MNIFITFFMQIATILQSILLVAAFIGGVFAIKNIRKSGIVQTQSETIIALQQQIDVLKEQSVQQQFELTAMREALKEEGIYITIDGERVTIKRISEPDTTRHIIKKPTTRKPTTPKEEG